MANDWNCWWLKKKKGQRFVKKRNEMECKIKKRNEKKKMANFFSAQDSKIVWIQKIDLMLKSVHTYTHAHKQIN